MDSSVGALMRAKILSPIAQGVIGMSLIVWLTYFYMCSELGLYQDDVFMYHIVHNPIGGVLAEAFDFGRAYAGEGRPGAQVMMVLLAWAGSKIGGITGLYVLNWFLLSIVAVLVFYCLRTFFSPATSFICATFYVLFPADEAKFFAISLLFDVSGILFWVAALLLLRKRSHLAVIPLLLIFTMNEAYLFQGFLLPLLLLADGANDLRPAIRKSIRFLAIYGLLVVPAVLYRLVFAPGRATEALAHGDKLELAKKVFQSVYFGMRASASSLYGRISEFLASGTSPEWTVAAITFGVLVLLLQRLTIPDPTTVPTGNGEASRVRAHYIVAFGLLAWAAAYPLYGLYPVRFPPTILIGKGSNVHGTAALGVTVLLAIVLHAIEKYGRGRWSVVHASRLLVGLYLGLLSGYFAVVQQRYVDNWHYQLSFWKQLPEAVPKLGPGSLVVVETVGEESTRLQGGAAFDWTLPHLFPFMWQIPSDWATMPLVISRYYFDNNARVHDGRVEIVGYPTLDSRSFSADGVTRLRVQAGRFFPLQENGKPDSERSYQLFDESAAGSTRLLRGEFQLRAANQSSIIITPNDFSGDGWKHGILKNQGGRNDMFYFFVSDKELNPIRVGSVLKFSGAGKAVAKQVHIAQQGTMYAVFVIVDRDLDPERDGAPNPIRVLRAN